MMLRSSSTPVLGSLLSSYSESPSSESHPTIKHPLPTTTIHHNPNNKLSFHHHPTNIPCNSSPFSPSIADLSINGFRRAHSEGNLRGLFVTAGSRNHDEFSLSIPPKRFSRRPNCSTLERIPSFSIHNARNRCENEDYSDEEEKEEEEEEENGALFENSIEGEEKSMALDLERDLGLKDEMRFVKGNGSLLAFEGKIGAEMYLARGLGADSINIGFGSGGDGGKDGGGGGGSGSGGAGGCDGDGPGMEEHYKGLVEENPGNPLFLRNYAQFLYEVSPLNFILSLDILERSLKQSLCTQGRA